MSWLAGNRSMTNITVQLPDELLEQVQSLAGNENLQGFLISAIEHEVERQQPSATASAFWDNLQQLRAEMQAEGIEIDPEEIWGNLRDRSVGREISL
jgi:predicted transcriptional regulator